MGLSTTENRGREGERVQGREPFEWAAVWSRTARKRLTANMEGYEKPALWIGREGRSMHRDGTCQGPGAGTLGVINGAGAWNEPRKEWQETRSQRENRRKESMRKSLKTGRMIAKYHLYTLKYTHNTHKKPTFCEATWTHQETGKSHQKLSVGAGGAVVLRDEVEKWHRTKQKKALGSADHTGVPRTKKLRLTHWGEINEVVTLHKDTLRCYKSRTSFSV